MNSEYPKYSSMRYEEHEYDAIFDRQQELFDAGYGKDQDFVQKACWMKACDELEDGTLKPKPRREQEEALPPKPRKKRAAKTI